VKRYGTYALLCAGVVGIAVGAWIGSRKTFIPLEHLPSKDATVLSVDFKALRKGGILSLLAAKPELEDPEYRSFVQATGFDYQKDLDSALVSFRSDATYFILRGYFDWAKLETYAKANGGSCYQELCHLSGSRPERRISFLPLGHELMGLAVATDDMAAARLRDLSSVREIDRSSDPLWLSVPSSALRQTAAMPAGTRLLASAVAGADRVMLTVGVKDGNYAAHLEAVCRSAKDAQAMAAQLAKLTSVLKDAVGKTSTADQLTGVLVAGTFQQADRKVIGLWPIQKKLLENLAGGM
jgi:hypothetical protein